MTKKTQLTPGDGPFKFRIKLLGNKSSGAAAVKPPFDIPTIFGTRARVPIKGTVNGFKFRSSLCNMGEGHFFVINKEIREGTKLGPGDMADIVIARDREERVVEVPPHIKKVIATNKKAQATWDSLSFTHKKEWVRAIEEAKRDETKKSRIEKMMAAMKAGKRVGF